jgi:hypothetical protein
MLAAREDERLQMRMQQSRVLHLLKLLACCGKNDATLPHDCKRLALRLQLPNFLRNNYNHELFAYFIW